MAERLDIVVTEQGAKVVRRNIEDVGKAGLQANRGIDLLRKTLGLLGGAFLIRQIIGLADSFTQLQNSIRVAQDGTGDLAAATERLFDISKRTRTSIEANVQLYQRLSFAAKELGATQEELFQFVETTGKALAIQGGASAAASGALLQLSQAMGSGIVRAEEFNSILEGAFPIALAAARGIDAAGGSVAKLRQLIVAGKVTSEEFFRGFLSQSEALDKQFQRTTPTIGQAFTVLRDSAIKFFGELDKGAGITALMSRSILALANNLDAVGRAALIVGAALAITFAPKIVGLIVLAGKAIAGIAVGLAVALGPIGLALTALVALTVATQELTGGLFEVEGVTVQLGDVITATFTIATKTFNSVADTLTAVLAPAFQAVGTEVTGLRSILAATFNFFVRTIDRLIGLIVGAAGALIIGFSTALMDLPATLEAAFVLGFNNAIAIAQTSANFIFSILRRLGIDIADVTFEPFKISGSAAATSVVDAVNSAFQAGLDVRPVEKLVGLIGDEALAVAKLRIEREKATKTLEEENKEKAKAIELTKKQATALQSLIDKLDPVGALSRDLVSSQKLLSLALDAGKISTEQFVTLNAELSRQFAVASDELKQKLNPAYARQKALLEDIRGPMTNYKNALTDLQVLLDDNAISQEVFNERIRDARIAMLDSQTDAASGAERAFLKIQRDAADFATQTENLVVGAFNGMQDALVEFTQTGKFEFSDLARSIAADLLRIGTNEVFTALTGGGGGKSGGGIGGLVTGLFGGASGGAGGGIGGLFSGLFGFQNGVENLPVNAASVANLGGVDNRLVAFRARSDEEISVRPAGSGGGKPVVINYNFPPGTNPEGFRSSIGQSAARNAAVLQRYSSRNN